MVTAMGTPVLMAFAEEPNVAFSESTSIEFAVKRAVPALGQMQVVDVTMIVLTDNLHGNGTVPPNTTIRLSSPVTSLTLRSGSDIVDIAASEAVTFAMPFGIPQHTADDLKCGVAQAECNAQISLLNDQLADKATECDHLANAAVFAWTTGRKDLDRCKEDLEALQSNATRMQSDCAALPAPCEGRGNCTGTGVEQISGLGRCSCDFGWSGAHCEAQQQCRFWDASTSSWSTAGCRVLNSSEDLAAGVGRLLCECDHLTDFALSTDHFLDHREALLIPLSTLHVNTPFPLAIWELVIAVTEMPASYWLAMAGIVLAIWISNGPARQADYRRAYRSYYPSWYGKLLGEGSEARSNRARFTGVILTQVAAVFATHPIFAAFVRLPTTKLSREQAVMIMYIVLLVKFYGQLLFWGTGHKDRSFAPRIWAWAIDCVLTFVSQTVTTSIFAWAMLKPIEVVPDLKKPDDGARKKKAAREDLDHLPSWELMCRQTVPARTSESLHAFSAWRYPLLLGAVKTADQFYSDKLHNPKEFRSKAGHLVCKLIYSKRSWCEYRPQTAIRWLQSTNPSESVVGDFTPTPGFEMPASFAGLRTCTLGGKSVSMGALETSLDAHEIRARRGFDFGGKVATGNQVAMHQGGSGARDQPIFLVGQRTPSEVGALTGEDTHT
eukprot:4354721-Prymnesium_polylepis.1